MTDDRQTHDAAPQTPTCQASFLHLLAGHHSRSSCLLVAWTPVYAAGRWAPPLRPIVGCMHFWSQQLIRQLLRMPIVQVRHFAEARTHAGRQGEAAAHHQHRPANR